MHLKLCSPDGGTALSTVIKTCPFWAGTHPFPLLLHLFKRKNYTKSILVFMKTREAVLGFALAEIV